MSKGNLLLIICSILFLNPFVLLSQNDSALFYTKQSEDTLLSKKMYAISEIMKHSPILTLTLIKQYIKRNKS